MKTIPLGILRICSSLLKCHYLKNEKLFRNFLFHLCNLHQILNIFQKKMIVITNVFPKLKTVIDLVKPLSWKRRFRISFDSQHVNRCQTLVKFVREHFCIFFFWWLWGEMNCKISNLFKFEILDVFVHKLTVNDKYPFRGSENLRSPIQMKLSEKRKSFSQFFVSFMVSPSNFKHYRKKDDRHR